MTEIFAAVTSLQRSLFSTVGLHTAREAAVTSIDINRCGQEAGRYTCGLNRHNSNGENVFYFVILFFYAGITDLLENR